MNLKIVISVDDVNPKPGWKIIGTPVEKWLHQLNERFGAKFTCFVPSCYHGEYPLSQHEEWVKEICSIPWLEIAAHGHFHQTSDPSRFGECEFAELSFDQVTDRLSMMWEEWDVVEKIPIGFKPPGWVINSDAKRSIEEFKVNIRPSLWDYPWFQYVSLHYIHNQNLQWNCKTFFGHDGINQTDISIHNGDMIMLTSHVAGDWNDNVWNQANFEQLCLSLEHLTQNYQCEFKTLNECLN